MSILTENRTHNQLIFLLILVLTFSTVYSVHKNYRFPLHADEWQHLALSIQIMEEEGLSSLNPYDLSLHVDTEPGFHILVSEILMITGVEPVTYYRFLPAIFACISNIMLFAFVWKLTKNRGIGFLSMIFFSTLKSNVNILGPVFLVPLTASIPLIYLFFLTVHQALAWKSMRRVYTLISVWIALFLIHPISAAFTAFVCFIYALTEYKRTMDLMRKLSVFIVIPVAVFVVFIRSLEEHWGGGITYIFVDHIVYEYGWGKTEILYALHDFYGYTPLLLALLGLIVEARRKEPLVPLWSLYAALNIYAYGFLEATVIAPFQRMLYYAMLGLTVLSGIGLYRLLDYVRTSLQRITLEARLRGYVTQIAITLTLAAVFYVSFSTYFDFPTRAKLYQVIEEDEYSAIRWIGDNYGGDNIVLADTWTSIAVYPITRNRVVGFVSAHIESDGDDFADEFFKSDCINMASMIEREGISLVITKERISCPGIELVYGNKTLVYETKRV
ncbi:MAG: hypothetical protein V1921_05145 [Candidatus Altiarchaeota archaeon]